ncbi:hypothetical protein H0H92_004358, partial [Tricholoma furcatifolium]
IHPFNPDIFTEEDYAPSMAFSTQAHVPSSFPETIPSSPTVIMTDGEHDSDYMMTASSDVEILEDGGKDLGDTWALEKEIELEEEKFDELVLREYNVMKSWDDLFMETTRGSTKIKACFVTHPELKVAFEEEEKEQMEKECVDAEKEAQKVADVNTQSTRIARGSVLKTFDFPITSYKKTEEFEVLATALEISSKGTVQELTQRIKDHLAQHKDQLKKTPQFAGLFTSGRCKKENPTSRGAPPDELTIIAPSMVEGRREESSCDVTSQQESPHQHFYTVHNTTYAPK